MALNKNEVRDLYRRLASHYDSSLWLLRLMGLRLNRYRRLAVEALALQPGDTVLDLGCGTGLNFPFMEQAIGPGGKIIGVDLTGAMLDQAHERARTSGWHNAELVQADLAGYTFPPGVAGILSTFAITMVPEYDLVIASGARALRPGGRMVIFDLKKPESWPTWLVQLGVWLNKPFGVSLDLADRHPWESVQRHLRVVKYQEFYFGALYLSAGQSPKA